MSLIDEPIKKVPLLRSYRTFSGRGFYKYFVPTGLAAANEF
jgi:hypothetical protein